MSSLDISKLKVTELRAELSQRKLPTKGKKDELVARLKEALEAEPESNKEQSNIESQQEDDNKEEASEEKTKTEETENSKADEEETKADDERVEEKDSNADQSNEQEFKEAVIEQIKESVEQAKEEIKETIVEQTKETKEQTTEEPKENPTEKESKDKINSKPQEEPKDEIMEEAETKDKTEEQPSEPADKEVAKDPIEAKSDYSEKEDSGSKRKRSLDRTEDDKRHKTDVGFDSSAIYVKGFVRPLILKAVQELFSSYGQVKQFWMDSIKTHSYVIYEENESAKRAYTAVDGLKYPPETGKKLSAGSLTVEQAQKLIEYEQGAAEKRMRVDWEDAIKKIKEGQDLPASDGSRKPRSLGIGQVARQLAQANEPVPVREERPAPERKQVALEDLFRKTQALPHLYYLPNTDEEARIRLEKIQKGDY